MNIGFDFGTTNSILSFYNPNEDLVQTYKLDGNSGADYIPSVLSFDEDNYISIGEEAKCNIGDEYCEIYSRFKVFLSLEDEKSLKSHGFISKTPKEITKLYIKELIKRFENDHQKIEGLVLTVPEIWLRDDNTSREVLNEILTELKLPLKKLISEPVSAGAYFLHHYKKEREENFNGHLLLFDYGGGTLDISLLETKDNHIKIIERTGLGKGSNFSGSAGVAFDERVINSICGERKKNLDNIKFYELVNSFERRKLETSRRHEKLIDKYLNEKENKSIFKLQCSDKNDEPLGIGEILTSTLIHSFSPLKEDINSALKQIKSSFNIHNVESKNSDKFRIVMVGGFSKFYLSQKAVKEFFNAKDDDKRFETYFKTHDIALAISKGATLIANDIINIDETYPLSVDLVVERLDQKTKFIKKDNINIFTKGDIVKTHQAFGLNIRIKNTGDIILEMDLGLGNKFLLPISKDREKLFPNHNKKSNSWEIGFSVDENSFVKLHLKDIENNEKVTNIGDILRRHQNLIIVE